MAAPLEQSAGQQEPAKKTAPKFDAGAYLQRTLPRQPGDLLKVFPMHGRHSFRVNWYNQKPTQQASIPGLNISYIRDSKFLTCRLNEEGTPEIIYAAKAISAPRKQVPPGNRRFFRNAGGLPAGFQFQPTLRVPAHSPAGVSSVKICTLISDTFFGPQYSHRKHP